MATIDRPDGARIHYEVHGSGFPLLLIAPGGVSSQVAFWERGPINPIRDFAADFRVIAMDQRHAGGSLAPAAPFSYDLTVADQLAVLDAVGAPRAHVMGGCIGCAHAWRLIHDAPARVAAAVIQNPVGLDETNSMDVFYRMFDETIEVARTQGLEGVIHAAMQNPVFAMNNAGGPFSQRLHDDPAFREELGRMPAEEYVSLVLRFRAGVWPEEPPFFTVSREWMAQCPAPMLVLPGSDAFHPTSIAHLICRTAPRARCLDVDCRSDGKLPATIESVREFLRMHTP
jgi:pimeloyl-ACP methyl ester carboxylesterase